MAKIELKYCPNISFYVKANYTSWGKNFKVTDGKLTYADGTSIQTKGGYYVKPISVGDKLGLVYWDGTFTPGTNASIKLNRPEGEFITARTNHDNGLSLFNNITKTRRTLREQAGTINLSGLNATVTVIETTGETLLKDHLWHVI